MQVPHIFSPGFPARSAEVNENFKALADAITALQEKVESLETSTATPPIPGTYSIIGMQTRVTANGTSGTVGGSVFKGTVVLRADQTASLAMDDFHNQLNIGPGGVTHTSGSTGPQEPPNDGIQRNGSWSQPPGTGLLLTLEGTTWRFARPAGRLFISNFHTIGTEGTDFIMFLVRNPGPAA